MTSDGNTDSASLAGRFPYRRLAGVVIAFGLLAALLIVADPEAVASELADIRAEWYLLGGVCFLGGYLPATVRWNQLQRTAGYPSHNRVAFEVIAVSYALNQLLPVNAGDVTRTAVVDRYYEVKSHPELAGLVVVERAIDFCVVVVLLGVGSLVVAAELVPVETYATGALLVVGGIAVIAGLWWRLGTDASRVADRLASRPWVPAVVATSVADFVGALGGLSRRTVTVVTLLGVARWLFVVAGFFLVARSVETPVGPALAAALVGGMSLASVLPLTPGGVGPGETVGVSVLVVGGVAEPAAVALVLLQRSYGVLLMAPLGIIVYLANVISGRPTQR